MEPGAALMHRLEEAAPDGPRSVRHCSPGSQSQCEDMGLGRARFDLAQAVNEARSGGYLFRASPPNAALAGWGQSPHRLTPTRSPRATFRARRLGRAQAN